MQVRAQLITLTLAGALVGGCGGSSSKHSSSTRTLSPALAAAAAQCGPKP